MYYILSHDGNDKAGKLSNRSLFASTTATAILSDLLLRHYFPQGQTKSMYRLLGRAVLSHLGAVS